jgi:hypothetical protein
MRFSPNTIAVLVGWIAADDDWDAIAAATERHRRSLR